MFPLWSQPLSGCPEKVRRGSLEDLWVRLGLSMRTLLNIDLHHMFFSFYHKSRMPSSWMILPVKPMWLRWQLWWSREILCIQMLLSPTLCSMICISAVSAFFSTCLSQPRQRRSRDWALPRIRRPSRPGFRIMRRSRTERRLPRSPTSLSPVA